MLGGKNKQHSQPLGYTIVEVMIVLAVSGMMFVIAANFINGKQQKTAFTEGVNELASRIQNVINQVKSGQYSDVNLNCTYSPPAGGVPAGTTTASALGGTHEQGQSPECVFMGKLIYFSYDNISGRSANYEVAPIAGGRLDASGDPVTTVQEAGPAVITYLTTIQTIPQNFTIGKMTVNGSAVRRYAIGFLQSPAVDGNGTLASGAEQIGLYYVTGLGAGRDTAGNGTGIAGAVDGNTVLEADSADICVVDSPNYGNGTHYADIVLGANSASGVSGTTLAVEVVMHGTTRPPTC